MTDDLFRKPDIKFRRKRRLKAPADGPLPKPPPKAEQIVLEAIEASEQVRDKAVALEDLITKSIATLTIPVTAAAVDTRKAVDRRDPLSKGEYITFELYMRALAAIEAARTVDPSEVRPTFTFHSETDSKNLSQLVLSKKSKLSKQDNIFMQSQAMYLYILQMMQSGFQALEAQKQTSTKFPPGTDAAPTILSLALSIAFLLKYTANSVESIKRMIDDLSGGTADSEQAIELAKTVDFKEHPLLEAAIESKAPSDYNIIVSYAHTFLTTTTKLGYEPWILLADVRRIKDKMNLIANNSGRVQAMGVNVDPAFLSITKAKATAYSKSLDYLGTALQESELPMATLCSLDWMLKLPNSVVALLKSIYQVYIAFQGIKLKNLLEFTFESNWENTSEEILLDILEMFSKIARRLLCWFQRDPEVWDILAGCPAISEMVDIAVSALEEIEGWIFIEFDKSIEGFRKDHKALVLKAQFTLEIKKIRMALKKLEFVEGAVDQVARNIRTLDAANVNLKVFENAAKEIGLRYKTKAENLADFTKKEFSESGFLENLDKQKGPDELLSQFDLPMVPFGECFNPNQDSPPEWMNPNLLDEIGGVDIDPNLLGELDSPAPLELGEFDLATDIGESTPSIPTDLLGDTVRGTEELNRARRLKAAREIIQRRKEEEGRTPGARSRRTPFPPVSGTPRNFLGDTRVGGAEPID